MHLAALAGLLKPQEAQAKWSCGAFHIGAAQGRGPNAHGHGFRSSGVLSPVKSTVCGLG